MASNVLPKTSRNHNNLNCDRIFRAKRQVFLIPLNRTAALPAALSNLTRPELYSVWLLRRSVRRIHLSCLQIWSCIYTSAEGRRICFYLCLSVCLSVCMYVYLSARLLRGSGVLRRARAELASIDKPKFHYAHFPVTSATSPWHPRDKTWGSPRRRRLPRFFPWQVRTFASSDADSSEFPKIRSLCTA